MFTNLATVWPRAQKAWAGFVPAEHPVVLAVKDSNDKLVGAVAINHPAPAKLGTATAIDVSALPLDSAHMIAKPSDAENLEKIPTFEFNIMLGGIDSFAMVAGGSDPVFDPAQHDYVSTLLHEMFHRYQFATFVDDGAGQDTEGYDFSADNLELAFLEERALRAAVEAASTSEREAAARHFAALRTARLAADDRVRLDNGQERGEGTARYLEHIIAGDTPGFLYRTSNFNEDLLRGIDNVGDVKESFSFGRFYASGAAVLHLLDQFGVANVQGRIEQGENPSQILADHLGMNTSNAADLVTSARSTYDPRGELRPMVEAEAAKIAGVTAPGDTTDAAESTDGEEPSDDRTVTSDQEACLAKSGISTAEPGGESILTDEQIACFD